MTSKSRVYDHLPSVIRLGEFKEKYTLERFSSESYVRERAAPTEDKSYTFASRRVQRASDNSWAITLKIVSDFAARVLSNVEPLP